MDTECVTEKAEEANIESKKELVVSSLKERIIELESLLPKDVFNFNDFYFAGGCIYSIFNGLEPKDYDIFCKSKKQ